MLTRQTRSASRRAPGKSDPTTAATKRVSSEHTVARESKRAKRQITSAITETDTSGAQQKEINGSYKEQFREGETTKEEVEKVAVTKGAEEEAEEVEEAEEIEVTVKQTKRKKTTKKSTEEVEEMEPLAVRTQGLRMYIGAHVSASKGIHNAVTNSVHIGGNAFALFLKSQRKWDNPPLQDEHRDLFKKHCVDHGYDASKYVLPHGSYLVNLAQEDPVKAKQAYDSFLDDLKRCEQLGIRLYNFHPGATNKTSLESALSRLAKALTSALDATKTVIPVLETTCGHGTAIGGPLSHFQDLFARIPKSYHDRLGICLDTCHSFAAGYDLRSPEGWNAFMSEFDAKIGLKYLRALHLNDSKTPLGSKRDLHANIGTGFLGLRGFHNVMNDKRLEGLPMILETPIDRPANTVNGGEDQEPGSSDKEAAGGNKKAQRQSKNATKTKTGKSKPVMVEDKSVWAREIKLLESLIGMDPESEEFHALEKKLADEGKAEREKHQVLFDKKKEKESKEKGKQQDLKTMLGGLRKRSKGTRKDETDESCGEEETE
ncbi:hypothetical protein VTO42DRAFT_268 [Malbranchea cinnamomea]